MKGFVGSVICTGALVVAGWVPIHGAGPQSATVKSPDSAADVRITQRLKADPRLKRYDITVSVDDSVATLIGTVPTQADRTKAAQLARVSGVTRVDNRIVVDLETKGTTGVAGKTKDGAVKVVDATKKAVSKTGEVITDTWITTRISADFVNEDLLKDSNINVDVKDNVVTLRGTVMSPASRARAVTVAKGIEGVKTVIDQMTIGPKK